mgnify:CR=1 FL=1
MKHLIAYDVETTGLSTQNDFIIQLSCIKVNKDDFKEIDSVYKFKILYHYFLYNKLSIIQN